MKKQNQNTEKKDSRSENEKEKQDRINELTIDLKRIQAEFENYRKRNEKENEQFKEIANANLITDLLPVIDSLEQGIVHNKEFVAVYEQLYSILKKNGVEKIDVNVGDEFDHDLMDCLMTQTSKELKDGVVAQVLSSGYKLNGKILRTTKISINKVDSKMEDSGSENSGSKYGES